MSPELHQSLSDFRRLTSRYLELTHEESPSHFGRVWRRTAAGPAFELMTDAHDAGDRVPAAFDADVIIPFDASAADRLDASLGSAGHERSNWTLFSALSVPTPAVADRFRILPGRAMPRAFLQLVRCRASWVEPRTDQHHDALTAILLDRLDSPSYEPWVALFDDRPLGCAALLQAGEAALLCDLFVDDGARRSGAATALVASALAFARRLAIRRVLAVNPGRGESAERLADRLGFRRDATIPVYLRAGAAPPWI